MGTLVFAVLIELYSKKINSETGLRKFQHGSFFLVTLRFVGGAYI